MDTTLIRRFRRWMHDEKAQRADGADVAFKHFFDSLPHPAPTAGFAERVLAQLGLEILPVPATAPAMAGAYRVGIAFALLMAGLVAATLPGIVIPMVGSLSPGLLTDVALDSLAGLVRTMSRGLALGRAFADVGQTLQEALLTPMVMMTIAASALTSIIAFRVLHQVLTRDRSSYYVESS